MGERIEVKHLNFFPSSPSILEKEKKENHLGSFTIAVSFQSQNW